ncbi:hypothetical protein BDN72DRAFT_840268 [Pluteus cervinus]|uniref:Uncharacterized protein n=1 Tax=Pluteus cervinus TaxID=181527 RepID=A0ACD3AUZ5_9AGAR|nr:hypothetical protein BDN72DRAFT_840268 [Pluteus cervinus]
MPPAPSSPPFVLNPAPDVNRGTNARPSSSSSSSTDIRPTKRQRKANGAAIPTASAHHQYPSNATPSTSFVDPDHPHLHHRRSPKHQITGTSSESTHHSGLSQVPPQSQPVDHIFIADGVASKKAGGKKAPLSCCECRRLKLKCDRTFPCASCKKRGCSEICPDGVLVSGKGTRFILANTEQLHSKIHEMSDRIRHLEEALESQYANCHCSASLSPPAPPPSQPTASTGFHISTFSTSSPSSSHSASPVREREFDRDKENASSKEPHPLLHPDLLGIKSTVALYGGAAVSGGSGGVDQHQHVSTPSQMQTSQMNTNMDVDLLVHKTNGFNKRGGANTNGMEVDDDGPRISEDGKLKLKVESSEHLDAEIMRLSHTFPLSDKISPDPNLVRREYIRNKLPSRVEADYLWDQAKKNALWQHNPHPSETFFPNLAHHCYSSSTEDLCPRRLALLLMILAIGCLVDLNTRGPDSPDAERYHHLARASLCEIPVMEETNVETITALFYEIWYLLVFSDKKKAAGYAWGLMGLTAKLAQSIGLHRNGNKSKVIPEEVEKRRALFWELMYLDARLSLSLGRPASLCINYMDCKRPSYTPDEGCDPSESSHYYQEWKHSCYVGCLAPVLDAISQPSLEYNVVLDLDKRIREFKIPEALQNGPLHSRSLILQRASLATALEAVLLQLHRSFFTRALSGPEEAFNRRHKYAPSVVAVFLSATRMIATVQDLFHREPELTSRILGYWSNAFSAAVALCLLVSRAPFTCLSPAALQELERARVLFNAAKDTCPRALQVIPILETMVGKANDIYNRWYNGQEVPTIVLRHTDEFPDTTISDPSGFNSPLDISTSSSPSSTSSPALSSSSITNLTVTGPDSFSYSHRSLSQCIVEVHQRARALFPMRKPCQCTNSVAVSCPPSHSWSPPPAVGTIGPVLPDLGSLYEYKGYSWVPDPATTTTSTAVALPNPQSSSTGGIRGFEESSARGSSERGSATPGLHTNAAEALTATLGYGKLLGRPLSSSSNSSGSHGVSSSSSSQHQQINHFGQSHVGRGSHEATATSTTGAQVQTWSFGGTSQPPLSPTSKLNMVHTLNFELGALNPGSDQSWMAFF